MSGRRGSSHQRIKKKFVNCAPSRAFHKNGDALTTPNAIRGLTMRGENGPAGPSRHLGAQRAMTNAGLYMRLFSGSDPLCRRFAFLPLCLPNRHAQIVFEPCIPTRGTKVP